MIDGIESYYQRIADAVTQDISEEWQTAKGDALFYADGTVFFAEYVRTTDGAVHDCGFATDGLMALKELRTRFRENGLPVWGKATFEVTAHGKFKMEFDYDNCEPNGDRIYDSNTHKMLVQERRKRLMGR